MSNMGPYDEIIKTFNWKISENELEYKDGNDINIGWYCSDRICNMGKGDKRRHNDVPKFTTLTVVKESDDFYYFKTGIASSMSVSKETVDTWYSTIGKSRGMKLKKELK